MDDPSKVKPETVKPLETTGKDGKKADCSKAFSAETTGGDEDDEPCEDGVG